MADAYAADMAKGGPCNERVRSLACRWLAERAGGRAGAAPGAPETGGPPVRWDGEPLEAFVAYARGRMATELQPWQVWLAGWLLARRDADGLPATRILALQVPRGAGKTQFAACLAAWTVEQSARPDVQVVVLATQLDAARETVKRMRDRLQGGPDWKFIGGDSQSTAPLARHANGIVRAKASTPQNADGISPTLVVLDEAARMDETFNRALSSLSKVPGSQCLAVTTPDADQYAAPWGSIIRDLETRLDAGLELPAGVVGMLYGADTGDDPANPDTWRKAFPGLGVTKRISDYELQRTMLLDSSDPVKRQEFWTQQLATFNDESAGAMPLSLFDACVQPWELDEVAGLPAVVAVDFSQGGGYGSTPQCDLTSLNVSVWTGTKLMSRSWHWWAGCDVDADAIRCHQPLREWIDQGKLVRCGGPTIDYLELEARIEAIAKVCNLRHFVADPAGKAAAWCDAMEKKHGWPWSRAPQRIEYMGSAWAIWSDLVRARRVQFAPDDVLRAALGATRLKPGNTGLWWPAKAMSRSNTDAVMACLMAAKVAQDREMLTEGMYADPSRIYF